MDSNKETILKYIKSLQSQIEMKDSEISRIRQEKIYLSDIVNSDYKKYKRIIVILAILLIISSGIDLYHLLL